MSHAGLFDDENWDLEWDLKSSAHNREYDLIDIRFSDLPSPGSIPYAVLSEDDIQTETLPPVAARELYEASEELTTTVTEGKRS